MKQYMFRNTDDYNQQAVGEKLEVFDVVGVIPSFLLFNSTFFTAILGTLIAVYGIMITPSAWE